MALQCLTVTIKWLLDIKETPLQQRAVNTNNEQRTRTKPKIKQMLNYMSQYHKL